MKILKINPLSYKIALNCRYLMMKWKSVKYINSYSFEIRDELISFYKKNKGMEQNKFISGLKNILGLNSDYQLKKAVKSKSAVKVRKPKKPSLLGKLRKYEKIIQEGLRQ